LTGLEDLIGCGDPNAAQLLSVVTLLGRRHGSVDDVEDRTQGHLVVEQITQEFDDTAQRAVAEEHEAEDQLPQPLLGDGQVKQYLVIGLLGSESVGQGSLSDVALPGDEFAADIEVVR
jgi:hypothetical protein